jgi:GntR family transcriptional regulator
VSEPKIAQELTMTSFTDDMRHAGCAPPARHSTFASRQPGRVSAGCCASRRPSPCSLPCASGWPDGESMAIETVHIRAAHVPGLTARDLEEMSFYELLRNRYGIVVVGGEQTIEPTVTDEDESKPSACRFTLRRFASSV